MNTRPILLRGFIKRIVGSPTIRQLHADNIYPDQKEYHNRRVYPTRTISERSWPNLIRTYNLIAKWNLFRPESSNENDYIHRHVYKRLEHLQNMGKEITSLPIDSDIKKLREVLRRRKTVARKRDDNTVDDLMSTIRDRIKLMNQQELAVLLTAIKADIQPEFSKVKQLIDLELRWLLKKNVKTYLMDIDLWFYLADTFYGCLMKSVFVQVLVHYMAAEKDIPLSNSQFIHLLFLVILQRDQRGILSKYEERILRILDKASFEDISTISLAYFKTKTQINNPYIRHKIIECTIEQLPTIDHSQPGYCAIIKSLRYSPFLDSREDIVHLTSALLKNSDIITSSAYNAVHTVKLLEAFRIYEPQILDLLIKTMFSSLGDYRIKDIQYGLTSLSNFHYRKLVVDDLSRKRLDDLCEMIISETRFDRDMQYYHLFPILRAFSILGYYNRRFLEYVNNVLQDDEKVNRMSDVLEFDKSALLVQEATRIEFGNYLERPNLFKKISGRIDRRGVVGSVRQDSSIKHLDFLLRSASISSDSELRISKMIRDLSKTLAAAKQFQDHAYKFNFQYTLPHTNFADLVISKGCTEPGNFDAETLVPKRVPPGQNHCLILLVRDFDYIDGYKRLSGYKMLITRLISKLGYTVIHVDLKALDIESLALRIRACLDTEHKIDSKPLEATIN